MGIVEYITTNSPITNLPKLLDMHHSNPLGLPVVAQLIIY